MWPTYLLVALFPTPLLCVFGDDVVDARGALVILAVTMLLVAPAGPTGAIVLMAGRSRQAMLNSLAGLAVNLGGNLLFVERYGITAAGAVWGATILVVQILTAWRVEPQRRGADLRATGARSPRCPRSATRRPRRRRRPHRARRDHGPAPPRRRGRRRAPPGRAVAAPQRVAPGHLVVGAPPTVTAPAAAVPPHGAQAITCAVTANPPSDDLETTTNERSGTRVPTRRCARHHQPTPRLHHRRGHRRSGPRLPGVRHVAAELQRHVARPGPVAPAHLGERRPDPGRHRHRARPRPQRPGRRVGPHRARPRGSLQRRGLRRPDRHRRRGLDGARVHRRVDERHPGPRHGERRRRGLPGPTPGRHPGDVHPHRGATRHRHRRGRRSLRRHRPGPEPERDRPGQRGLPGGLQPPAEPPGPPRPDR